MTLGTTYRFEACTDLSVDIDTGTHESTRRRRAAVAGEMTCPSATPATRTTALA